MNATHPSRFRPFMLAACCGMALAACGGKGGENAPGDAAAPAKAAAAVPVEAALVARRPIAASYITTAALEAPGEAQVVAKTSGVLLELMAEEGDRVRAGQVLARIDPDRPRLDVARTEATLRKLESNYARSQQLAERGLVSADANEQLRYDLAAARAAYEMARLELSYTTITAPIDGVIAQRMVKTGNLIQLNSALFRIVDDSALEAVLNVPEREMAIMKPGQAVSLRADAMPGRVFEGRVARVSPVVDAGSGTFRVVAAFDGGGELRPGMFGRIAVTYDQREDALTVPRAALLEDEGTPAVYAVRDGKAVRTAVEVGYTSSDLVEIRGGLADGERVVTAGRLALRDGASVEVIGDGGPAQVAGAEPAAAAAAAAGAPRQ
ncbi:efflux RND transporter periplasmic adaptor subunit [Coralloluteibacterium thermophilus]|uniref:Efflux RND transporter periplasmic adaptor subunit n=1 Tax=Coralloluteibacterium thermophilum TaxID=2707049 RepID=A0ABV9NKF9_9GAMM